MYLMITYLFIHIVHLYNVFPEVLKQNLPKYEKLTYI